MFKLVVASENDTQSFPLPEGGALFLGRAKECDIHLPAPTVSRRHAVIILKNGFVCIKDLGSFNGTIVNDAKIQSPRILAENDVIRISSFTIHLKNDAATEIRPAPTLSPDSPAATPAAAEAWNALLEPLVPPPPPRAADPDGTWDAALPQAALPQAGNPAPAVNNRELRETDTVTPEDIIPLTASPRPPPGEWHAVIDGADESNANDSNRDGIEGLIADIAGDDTRILDTRTTKRVKAPRGPNATGLRPDAPPPAANPGRTSTRYQRADEHGMEAFPPQPAFLEAMDKRLELYSRLADLEEERKLYRLGNPSLPDPVLAELDRQDRECRLLPTAEEADKLLDGQHDNGGGNDDATLWAEDMAATQWRLIRDANRGPLLAAIREGSRAMADEPLARELSAVGINHNRLLGGALYLVLLRQTARAAAGERNSLATSIHRISETGETSGSGGVLSKLGRVGQGLNRLMNRERIRAATAALTEKSLTASRRAEAAVREARFLEHALYDEFFRVYADVAVRFAPVPERMPPAVRAFLRYGVVGFQPWWLSPETAERVLSDCTGNIVSLRESPPGSTDILYADEYLAAVANMECSAIPDERLTELGGNSPEARTDRAYRRIVNARNYNVRMEEMLADLDGRLAAMRRELDGHDTRIAEAAAEPRETVLALERERQLLATRIETLQKHAARIEKQVVASIVEAVEEAEGRFRRGELKMPDPETLLRREVGTLADMHRRVSDDRPEFIPTALRGHFVLRDRKTASREDVREKIAEIERLDPGVFLNVVIPAKKRPNRVAMRQSPLVLILPGSGVRSLCAAGRSGMESGRLVLPCCFAPEHARDGQITGAVADYRWETSKKMAGRDVLNSDTLAGTFMKLRWDWRHFPKEKRERGLVVNDLDDSANWRKVYELYLSDAVSGARLLFTRNPECYSGIVGKFIDLPEGVEPIRTP